MSEIYYKGVYHQRKLMAKEISKKCLKKHMSHFMGLKLRLLKRN
ncbi:hypothetical protein [Bacillus phage FI_KG-Lek]|nr:hypothetical protein [Bacillus phage FI_KG-Lek]